MADSHENIRKQAEILRELGITPISEELITQIEKSFYNMPDEVKDSLNVTAMLLSCIGSGSFDMKEKAWVPTSDMVYSFDVESFDFTGMYTHFLQGIIAISNNEFEITQIKEDTSGVDFNSGSGIQIIQFCYNGTPYSYKARAMYDWFDEGMLEFMNQVLENEKNPKRLYFMSDGYQECIVFYCTQFWAKRFEKATGCSLQDKLRKM